MAYLPVYVNLLGSGTSVPHYGEAKASLPIKFHLFLVSEISGKKLKLVPFTPPFTPVNESPLFLVPPLERWNEKYNTLSQTNL